jgi:hypothetical protein
MAENLLDGARWQIAAGLAVHVLPGMQHHRCAHVHNVWKGFFAIGSVSKKYL